MTAPGCEWLYRPEMSVSQLWSPPKDPEKPRLPYIPGFNVSIRRHVAPPPCGPRYGPGTRPLLSVNHMHSITQSELVMTNPPLQTEQDSPAGPDTTARMTITRPIVIGSSGGAQVVVCTIAPDGDSKPFQAVAKIYDALYYRFTESLVTEPRDVVMQADEDYSREVAAYQHLRKAKQTGPPRFVPEYFGSWTFDLAIIYKGESLTRPVRMILIERLDGTTLRDAMIQNDGDGDKDAFHYPEEWRLEVLARAMDGFVRQQYIGVDQADFADRNVMMVTNLVASDSEQVDSIPLPRVVLIDYHNSTVYSLLDKDEIWHLDLPGPCNPLWHFWDVQLRDFVGWIPDEWFQRPKLMQEWLLQRFGSEEKKALYAPIQVDMKLDQDE